MLNAIRFRGEAVTTISTQPGQQEEEKPGLDPRLFADGSSLDVFRNNKLMRDDLKNDALDRALRPQPFVQKVAIYLWLRHLVRNVINNHQLSQPDEASKAPLINHVIAAKKPFLFQMLKKNGAQIAPYDQILQAEKDLNQAIQDDDEDRLNQCLAVPGININTRSHTGLTPLQHAILLNSPNLVKRLLAVRADVNQPDNEGRAALHRAVILGNPEIIQDLLAAKADVNLADKEGNAPLHRAVLWGNDEIVQTLLDAKAEINQRNLAGQTPLFCAVQCHDYDAVKVLLNAHAQTDIPSKLGYTPLYQAIVNGDRKIVKTLIQAGADVNRPDQYGRTPVLRATISGNVKILQDLLDANAAIHHADKEGRTPLGTAVRYGNRAIAQALVDARKRYKEQGLHQPESPKTTQAS